MKSLPSPRPADYQKILLSWAHLLQNSLVNWWLGWDVGELGVIQATQELEEGCPLLSDISSSSLLAKGQAKFCLIVSRSTCWGPKESFLTRILLCPHCEKHSFLKVGVYWLKHVYILFPWRTSDWLLRAQGRPNDLRVVRCQLQILFHILS